MKTLLTILIFFGLLTPAWSQTHANINELKSEELRKFLLNQKESEPVRLMVKKHNTSRITAYSFLAASLILAVASDKSADPDTDHANSILLSTGAWISFGIAGACGIAAGERLKKAKSMYLKINSTTLENSAVQIRDEANILDAIF